MRASEDARLSRMLKDASESSVNRAYDRSFFQNILFIVLEVRDDDKADDHHQKPRGDLIC